jgi:hypothetical protein
MPGRSLNPVTSSWRDPLWPQQVVLQGDDVSPSEWILPRLLPLSSRLGTRVASIVPYGYPAYARVLHPARRAEPDSVTNWRQVDVTWRDIADWSGRTYHPLMQFGRLSLARPDSTYPPPYTQEPQTGSLSSDQSHILYSVLAAQTTTPDVCWLGIWEGWGGLHGPWIAAFAQDPERPEFKKRQEDTERVNAALADLADFVEVAQRFEHPGRRYLLARAPCSSVRDLDCPPLDVTPSLVWPEDRAWCVGSEIDFDSTLIAGSEECVTVLLSQGGLEVVRVEPKDRLDIDGDVINVL